MDLAPLPTGFWLCLAGTVAGGGLALTALWCLVRRVRAARVRRLGAQQDGSTIIEFPFAMIVLILCALLTWQLGYLISAYLVVDYAAFAAVRSAVVVIPEKASDEEPEHELADVALEGDGKGRDIRQAAAFVCYPVSAAAANVTQGDLAGASGVTEAVLRVPYAQKVFEAVGSGFARRFLWAQQHTDARVVVPDQTSGAHTFKGGDVVTVEVTHDFGLGIPIAARIFGQLGPEGYTTPVKARASMLYEGFAEKVPEGVEP